MEGSGSFSRYSENGIMSMRNISRTVVIASPISEASDSTSALNSVFATIDSVKPHHLGRKYPACCRPATDRAHRTAHSLITAA